MSRSAKWLIVAFVVWWIVHDPTSAGAEVHNLAGFATQAAGSLSSFISSI